MGDLKQFKQRDDDDEQIRKEAAAKIADLRSMVFGGTDLGQEIDTTIGQNAYVEAMAAVMTEKPARDDKEAAAMALAAMALMSFRGSYEIACAPSMRAERQKAARRHCKEFAIDLQRHHLGAIAKKVVTAQHGKKTVAQRIRVRVNLGKEMARQFWAGLKNE